MTADQAKKEACKRVANLIGDWLAEGQPDMDCEERVHGWTDADAGVLERSFREIQTEMDQRATLPEDEEDTKP